MASMRKRYADRIEASPRQDDPPVSVPPTGAAKPPEPVADVKPPPEMPETKESPADAAAKHALRERLREMENAETLNRQTQQQPQYAAEPPPRQQPQPPSQDPLEAFLASVPEPTAKWLRAHPEYMTDQRKNAALQHFHWVARDEAGEEFTPRYIERLEHHLGLRQQSNGHQSHVPKQSITTPAPRYEAPPRQQHRQSAPVSAPPSREPASMSTGRPASRRVPLTAEQVEIAKASGISVEEYERQLIRMNQMKAAGQLDDRR
jgi:hypothetical protein